MHLIEYVEHPEKVHPLFVLKLEKRYLAVHTHNKENSFRKAHSLFYVDKI